MTMWRPRRTNTDCAGCQKTVYMLGTEMPDGAPLGNVGKDTLIRCKSCFDRTEENLAKATLLMGKPLDEDCIKTVCYVTDKYSDIFNTKVEYREVVDLYNKVAEEKNILAAALQKAMYERYSTAKLAMEFGATPIMVSSALTVEQIKELRDPSPERNHYHYNARDDQFDHCMSYTVCPSEDTEAKSSSEQVNTVKPFDQGLCPQCKIPLTFSADKTMVTCSKCGYCCHRQRPIKTAKPDYAAIKCVDCPVMVYPLRSKSADDGLPTGCVSPDGKVRCKDCHLKFFDLVGCIGTCSNLLPRSMQLLALHNQMCSKAYHTLEEKNHDYCGGKQNIDPFANFRASESLTDVPAMMGILTRMTDKFLRIKTFIQTGVLKVKDESVDNALIDIINYCILIKGMIEEASTNVK